MLSLLFAFCAVLTGSAPLRFVSHSPIGRSANAFPIRGIKGLWWQGDANYRRALPWLAQHHLNFLMLCYTSFPESSWKWRDAYTPEEIRSFHALSKQARRLGVHLCLAINPGIWSRPPLVYSSKADFDCALAKVRQAHAAGIHWFALCLDDINQTLQPPDRRQYGTLQAAQVSFVNRLWHGMQDLVPKPNLIFCPSAYTTADAQAHRDYIEAIGAGVDPAVRIFWTGPVVCSPSITAADARRFAKWIRRKPFVWDNYPVNDMFPWRPLLAPVKGRSRDLASEVSGYLANPMKQWFASTLPLTSLAAYLNDPEGYQPRDALRRMLAEYPAHDRAALRLLIELYGSRFLGEAGYPPRPRPRTRAEAARERQRYQRLVRLMGSCPDLHALWEDVRPTVEADLAFLDRKAGSRLNASPLRAQGDEFEGGAADLFGYNFYGKSVNYVYARATGRYAMQADFVLADVPPQGVILRLTARDDDSGKKLRVRILWNGHPLVSGASPFESTDFRTLEFAVAPDRLRRGRNVLRIENGEERGTLGMPPWFMIAEAVVTPRAAKVP
ncbi:MAG: beta-N-acetylglucosaminidase domain-containing protein [Chthonomonadales bacterium]